MFELDLYVETENGEYSEGVVFYEINGIAKKMKETVLASSNQESKAIYLRINLMKNGSLVEFAGQTLEVKVVVL